MPNQGALTEIDPAPILIRIQAGESLRSIATQLGVSNVGLRAWLLREDREQYNEVITAALTSRVADADEMLETAPDAVSIARAREVARFARMDLERRRPGLYGAKPAVAIGVQGEGLTVNVVSYSNAAPLPVDNLSTEDSDSSK